MGTGIGTGSGRGSERRRVVRRYVVSSLGGLFTVALALAVAGHASTAGATPPGGSGGSATAVALTQDLYVASSSGSVAEWPANQGTEKTITNSVSSTAIAVDAAGDVFEVGPPQIGDLLDSNCVWEVKPGGSVPCVRTFNNNPPGAVAVDAAGDVYVALDSNNVVEIPSNGGSPITTNAQLNDPEGMAVDPAGDVYVADTGNGRVVEVPAGGGSSKVVATGLDQPWGIAIASDGNVVVSQKGANTVTELLPGGAPSNATRVSLGSGFSQPKGVTVDSTGNVLVADSGNARIVEIPADGTGQVTAASGLTGLTAVGLQPTISGPSAPTSVQATAGNGQASLAWTAPASTGGSPITGYVVTPSISGTAQSPIKTGGAGTTFTVTGLVPNTPYTFKVAATNGVGTGPASAASTAVVPKLPATIYVTDRADGHVVSVSSTGGSKTTIGSGLSDPAQVAVDGAGDVYVADTGNNRVVEFRKGGGTAITIGTGLSAPQGVAVDPQGDVFIADTGHSRVVEVPADGGPQSTVGTGFLYPTALALDAQGDLYVANTGDNQVVEVPASGSETIVGSGLSVPQGVAVDQKGDIFVADTGHNRVVELPAASAPGGASGTQVTLATSVAQPQAVAVDASGDVFVADTGGNRVVAVPAGGTQSTVLSPVTAPQGVFTAQPPTVPAAPTAVTAIQQGGQISLSWTAPGDNGGQPVTGWVVVPSVTGVAQSSIRLTSATTGYTLTGVTQHISYTFTVAAVSSLGTGSASLPSAAVVPTLQQAGDIVAQEYSPGTQMVELPVTGGVTPLTSGFNYSAQGRVSGLVLDGAGDVYAANDSAGQVLEEHPNGSVSSLSLGALGTHNRLLGIAADDRGNFFFSTSYQVYELPGNGGPRITIYTILGAGGGPSSVPNPGPSLTVDRAGDLFFTTATRTSGVFDIYKLGAAGGTPSLFAVVHGFIGGLGTDATGNLYVGLSGGSTGTVVKRITPTGTKQTTLGGTDGTAGSLGVTAGGSVYYTIGGNGLLMELPAGSSSPGRVGGLTRNFYDEVAVQPATGYPAPPLTPRARESGHGQATVSWVPSINDEGSTITSYTVTAYTSTGTQVGQTTVGGSATSAVVSGLTPTGSYYFTVYATNGNGSSGTAYKPSYTIDMRVGSAAGPTVTTPLVGAGPGSSCTTAAYTVPPGVDWVRIDAAGAAGDSAQNVAASFWESLANTAASIVGAPGAGALDYDVVGSVVTKLLKVGNKVTQALVHPGSGQGGGEGAEVDAELRVTPGETLYETVGQPGLAAENGTTWGEGFPGGGEVTGEGAGGGATLVSTVAPTKTFVGGTHDDWYCNVQKSDLLTVAGGGGGAGTGGIFGDGDSGGNAGVLSLYNVGTANETFTTVAPGSNGGGATGGTGGGTANGLYLYGQTRNEGGAGGGGAGLYGGNAGQNTGFASQGGGTGGGGGSSYMAPNGILLDSSDTDQSPMVAITPISSGQLTSAVVTGTPDACVAANNCKTAVPADTTGAPVYDTQSGDVYVTLNPGQLPNGDGYGTYWFGVNGSSCAPANTGACTSSFTGTAPHILNGSTWDGPLNSSGLHTLTFFGRTTTGFAPTEPLQTTSYFIQSTSSSSSIPQSAPTVTRSPVLTATTLGGQATFTAAATGTPTPTVQWQVSTNDSTWTNIPGATSPSYSFLAATAGDYYRAAFTNAKGTATTAGAQLVFLNPPAITEQPGTQDYTANQSLSLTAGATSTARFPTTVQWQSSTNGATWSNVAGATSATYTFTATGAQSGEELRAIFTNVAGFADTQAASLVLRAAPVVTLQPVNQVLPSGQMASFSAAAVGGATRTVQWQSSTNDGASWTSVGMGGQSDVLSVTVGPTTAGNLYRAVFTDAVGTATTTSASLTEAVAPSVTTPPQNTTVAVGGSATFSVVPAGTPTPTVQWASSTDGGRTWSAVTGATADTYAFTPTTPSNGSEYEATLTNVAGSVTTTPVTLTVTAPLTLSLQPENQTIDNGTTVTLGAVATGLPEPTEQWQLSTNGGATFTNIPGDTGAALSVIGAPALDGALYRAVFANGLQTVTTRAATLHVHYVTVTTTTCPATPKILVGTTLAMTASAKSGDPLTVTWSSLPGTWATTTGTFRGVTMAGMTLPTTSADIGTRTLTATFTDQSAAGSARYDRYDTAQCTFTVAPGLGSTITQAPAANGGTPVPDGTNQYVLSAKGTGFPRPTVTWQESSDGGTTWTGVATGVTTTAGTVNGNTGGGNTVAATSLSLYPYPSDIGHQYRVVFTNAFGTATSTPVTLEPATPQVVTQPAASTTVPEGQTLTLAAKASGAYGPLTVQWYGPDHSAITGATSTTYTVNATQLPSGCDAPASCAYYAVFTNSLGVQGTSAGAQVTVDKPPAFTSPAPPTTGAVGQPYQAGFTAAGFPAPTYSLAAGAPAYLSINATTGTVAGTPTPATTTFTYSVVAANGVTPAATAGPFTVTVAGPTLSTSPTTATATTVSGYAGQLSTAGGFGSVTYTQTTGSPAITVSPTGAVSAPAPLAPGLYRAGGTDVDAFSESGTWSFSLTVKPVTLTQSGTAPSTLTASGKALALSVPVGHSGAGQLTTTGGAGTVAYHHSAASPYFTVSTAGAISVPASLSVGMYGLSGTDSDPYGDTGTWSVTVTVTPSTLVTTPTTGTATRRSPYAGQLVTTGNVGALTYRQSTGSPDITVSPSGVVSAPASLAVGSYRATGMVADAQGDSDPWTFTLTVVGDTLTTTPITDSTPYGAPYAAQLVSTGGQGPTTYVQTTGSAVSVSSSGAVSAPATLVSGTYRASGTDTDAYGDSGTWSFTLTETNVPATASLSIDESTTPPTFTHRGQPLTMSYLVTNTGNVGLSSVAVQDAGTGSGGIGVSGISCPSASLRAGTAETCTATYLVTEADLLAGSFSDSATASGVPPAPVAPATATATSAPLTVANPAGAAAPSVSISESATPPVYTALGQRIALAYQVTNTGNVPLTTVAVDDQGTKVVDTTCPSSSLPASTAETCTGSYVVTQPDIIAGSFTDTASATAVLPGWPTAVTSATTSLKVTDRSGPAAPSLSVTESATPTTYTYRGQALALSYLVINTGNVPLTTVAVDGTAAGVTGLTCPSSSLPAGAVETCTATYAVTQADIIAGSFADPSSASAVLPGSGPVHSATTSLTVLDAAGPAAPALSVTESATPSPYATAGQPVTLSYQVTNTGNVPLTTVAVDDTTAGVTTATCPAGTLAASATETCTATWTPNQADLDAQTTFTDSASAVAVLPGQATPVASAGVTLSVPATARPSLSLSVTENLTFETPDVPPTTYPMLVASRVTADFIYTVRNNGSQTLSGITLGNTLSGLTGLSCPQSTLAPGQHETCVANYVVGATPIANLLDAAAAFGTPPGAAVPVASPYAGIYLTAVTPDFPQPTYAQTAGAPQLTVASTGAFSGVTPGDYTASGVYEYHYYPHGGPTQWSFSLDLGVPGPASLVPSTVPLTAVAGSAYKATFTPGGFPNPAFTLTATAPAFLSINPTTGTVSGVPAGGISTFTYSVTASNEFSPSATAGPFTVSVTPATLTTTPAAATTPAGSPFTDRLSTAGANGAVTYTQTQGTAFTVAPTGSVSAPGTLPVGTYTVAGTDVDANGDPGTWSYGLTVESVPLTTTPGSASTTSTTPYAGQLATTGGIGSLVYTQMSGGPAVLVSPTGAISATGPLVVGAHPASGTVTDSLGDTGNWSFTLTATSTTLTTTPATDSASTGSAYAGQLATTGGIGAVTYTETTGVPAPGTPGITVATTGTISAPGTLTVGDHTVGGTEVDSLGDTGTWTFTLTVQPVPLTTTPSSGSTPSTTTYAGQLTTSGGFGPVAYTQTSGSPAIVVSTSGAVTSTAPLATGTYTARGTETDALGDTGTWAFILTVTGTTLTTPPSGGTTAAGTAYTGRLTTTGGSGTTTYLQSQGGSAVTVAATGAVSAPGTLAVGTYVAKGTDADSYGDSGTWSFTLTVTPTTLTTTPTSGQTTAVTPYSGQLSTTGGSGTVTYTQTSGSPQISVSSSGAVASASPLGTGMYQATGTEVDGLGDTGTWTFTLTVTPAPLAATLTASVPAGTAYAGQLSAVGGAGTDTYTQTAGSPSVTVSPTGAVSAPDTLTVGRHTATGSVVDAYGSSGTWSVTLTVSPNTLRTTPGTGSVTRGNAYSGQLTTTGGIGVVQYTGASSTTAVTVTSTGAVTAGPTLSPGTYSASGTTSDGLGDTGTWAFTLTVNSLPLTTTPGADWTGSHTPAYGNQLVTTGGAGPYTYTETSDTEGLYLQPATRSPGAGGLTVSPTGALSAPADLGTVTGEAENVLYASGTVTDADGNTAPWAFTLYVTSYPKGTFEHPTELPSPETAVVTAGQPYSACLTFPDYFAGRQVSYPVANTVTQLTGAPAISVGSNGCITAPGSIPVGTYQAIGIDRQTTPSNQSITPLAEGWTFTLTVASSTLTTTPGTASITVGATYSGQLSTSGSTGAVTYGQTTGTPDLTVSPTGSITALGTLPVGSYTATGTESDTAGDTGSWSFTLTVTPSTLSTTPTTISVPAGTPLSATLSTSGAHGPVTYAESWGSSVISVTTTGAVSAPPTLSPGLYLVAGTATDTSHDSDNWSVLVNVTAVTLATSPTEASTGGTTPFAGQLDTTGGTGAVTYTQTGGTQTTGSYDLTVSPTGAVAAPATLPTGVYTASGTDQDSLNDTGTWSFTLYVTHLTTTPTTGSVVAGTAYSGQLTTAGGTGHYTYTQTSGAPDLVVAGTGAISAPDTLAAGGPYGTSGTVTDQSGDTNYWSFTLTVTPVAPTFTAGHTTPPTTGVVGTPYSYTFAASGYPAPTFTLGGGAPTWLHITSTTGTVTGTPPTETTSFSYTVTATNSVTHVTTAPITVTVTPALVAPAFTAATPPTTGVVGTPYSYTFAASGYPPPTFSLGAGAPTWLTINATTGAVTGTPPTGTTTFSYTVTATNSVTHVTTAPITVTVTPALVAPAFTADTAPTTGVVGTPYSYTFAASGYPPPTFSLAAGAPTWLHITSTTGTVTGTPPTETTSFSYTVKATNSVTTVTGPLITVTVTPAATAPAFTTGHATPPSTAVVGTAYSYTFTASGSPTPHFSLTGAPSWLTINATTGAVTGTPPAGTTTFSYSVTATNSVTHVTTAPFTVTVTPALQTPGSTPTPGTPTSGTPAPATPTPPPVTTTPITPSRVAGDYLAAVPDGSGYWVVTATGSITDHGSAAGYGSMAGQQLNQPIVGIASTPDGKGYWLVASDGGIFAFGDAQFYGSTGDIHLNQPIVGMASTPDGKGYWLVAADGGVFAYGDAQFYGSTGSMHLNQPVVGMAAMPDGGGYWLVAADGGVFAFGDAPFHGSLGDVHLNQPIEGVVTTPDGGGYWLVAPDGGVFCFGDAQFHGSLGGSPPDDAVIGLFTTADGSGYTEVDADGTATPFGDS